MERVGVFLCTGCDIGSSLKTDGLPELATGSGATHFAAHPCLCAPEGVASIRAAVDAGAVDGVVVAACSQRHKQAEFRFDPAAVQVERVALREQVAWTHVPGDEDTQALAEDLLRMGIVRARKMVPAKRRAEGVEQAVLVVGGGLAGLQAAQAAAGMGHPVVVVERSEGLGGHLARVREVVPDVPPYDRLRANPVPALARAVREDGRIRLLTGTRIVRIAGQPGQFAVEVEGPGGREELRAGAIVQATGARPYDASRLQHLGMGASPDVITSAELEPMLWRRELERPSDHQRPRRVVFVQCAGSRDQAHLGYCSSECCATSLRQVMAIHQDWPEVECAILYRDLRAPGQVEHFYRAVQEQSGVMLARGTVEGVVPAGAGLRVSVRDSLLGEKVEIDADLVVLATGMVPNSADGEAIRQLRDARARVARNESEAQRKAAEEVAAKLAHHDGTEILNLAYRQGPDLPVLEDGFPDSHYICFPYETRRTGIYAAGAVRAPMDPAQAAEDGWGAAMKATQLIAALGRGEAVHPRSGDFACADFFLQRCTQCKRCTEECPFGSLDEDAKGTPQYNASRCRRCGICMGACPERIISYADYSVDAVASMIKAIEVPDESEEKPRILALLCENDAYPALDDAAARRAAWNPWVRVIPVRCLGSVNIVWIAESLSRGIDGVILVGCKRGGETQCHYVKGSELAHKRLENVQETLTRLSLEAERVRVVELARNEMARIPALFDEFAQQLEELGANPLKGF
ncbi:MAG TPA: hydrogenase iron-sulfur subunit [Anaeromyxobacteraceae bacterium]|nr:hydrogenase iron-sulfur subunit [Anaeromyxobacteraceae bacterium]